MNLGTEKQTQNAENTNAQTDRASVRAPVTYTYVGTHAS